MFETQGKKDEAEALYKRALAIYENAAGASQLDIASTIGNLGNVKHLQGKYEEAEGLFKRPQAPKIAQARDGAACRLASAMNEPDIQNWKKP